MPRVVTYCRSATESALTRLTATSLSPEATLVGAFWDDGGSGLVSPDERSGFSALLETVAREGAELLVIPAWHHLSRDRRALPALMERLTRAGLRVQVAGSPLSTCDFLPRNP